MKIVTNNTLTYFWGKIKTLLAGKQNATSHLVINDDPLQTEEEVDNIELLNSIESIDVQESNVAGGNNVVTITTTQGDITSFNVMNGADGGSVSDDIALVQDTGARTDAVMSQKAVTSHIKRLTNKDLESIENMQLHLPDGYTMLDYIDSGTAGSGAQIDTGLVPSDANWRFVGSWNAKGFTSAYSPIIASYSAETENCYRIIRYNQRDDRVYVGAYQRANACTVIYGTSLNTWYGFDLQKGKMIWTNTGSVSSLGTTTGTVSSATMKLGTANTGVMLGEFTAYHNGELVSRMIPCKTNNAVGMYDIIRENFYTSTNGNNFIAGNEITQPFDKLLNGNGLANLIAQETGDYTNKVMSQKAITDAINYNRSITNCQCVFLRDSKYFYLSDTQYNILNNTEIISIVFVRMSAFNPTYTTEWRYFRLRGASSGSATDGFYMGCASGGRMYYQTYANDANNQAAANGANIYNYNNNASNKICPAVSVVVWDRINGIVKFYDRSTLITTKQDDAYKLTGFIGTNKNIYMFPGDDDCFLYDLQIYNYDIMGVKDSYINQLEGANYIDKCYNGNIKKSASSWASTELGTYGNSTTMPYTTSDGIVTITSTSSCVANSTTTQRGYYVGSTDVARRYESDIEVVSGECKINNRTPNIIEKIVDRNTGDVYSAGDTLGVGEYTICGKAFPVGCWSLTYMSGDPMVVKHTENRQKYISCVMHLKCDMLYNGELYDDQAEIFYDTAVEPSNAAFKMTKLTTSYAPNFVGQMAASGNNVYVGSKGYIWKQINNS